MKLRSILRSQATLFVKGTPVRGTPFIPELLEGLRERYGFLEIPKSLAEFNATQGITFLHGKFRRDKTNPAKDVVIDKFQYYENGIQAETRATAEDADAFLDDILEWGSARLGLKTLDYPPRRRFYESHIEFQSSIDVTALLEPVRAIGNIISELLSVYDDRNPSFTAIGFSLHCDSTQPPVPINFTFERRSQTPHNANIFFSSAPLRTADHIKLLEQIERLSPALKDS